MLPKQVHFAGFDGKTYRANVIKRKNGFTVIQYPVRLVDRVEIVTAYLDRSKFAARCVPVPE